MEEAQSSGDLLGHRAWGRRRLRQVRERVQLQGRLASKRRQLRDLVTEDLVPDIGSVCFCFLFFYFFNSLLSTKQIMLFFVLYFF